MPIKDLLWACPLCLEVEALDLDGRCSRCRATFRRGPGARIIARAPGRPDDERLPLEWLARLPGGDIDAEGHALPPGVHPPFSELVLLREADTALPVRKAGIYLGLVERFGATRSGTLTLSAGDLVFTAQSGGGNWAWPLDRITAIQPASSAIQLKAQDRPVVSVTFRSGSVRLWEQRLKYCVRQAYREVGRGEITEFQPRIRSR